MAEPVAFSVVERYHVPRSQVWEGSRGGARGNVHLHVTADVKIGRLTRRNGQCLCSKKNADYAREPDGEEFVCPKCAEIAVRYGITWPSRELQSGFCPALAALDGKVHRCQMPKKHNGLHEDDEIVWRDDESR